MNTPGKVCLALTIILLGVGIYLGGRLGNYANSWSTKLRDGKAASQKAVADNTKTLLDLRTAQAELNRLKLGWGHEWTFLPGNNVGGVQAVGNTLGLTGLGSGEPALAPRQVQVDGREQLIVPTIHVFALDGQGGSSYTGEFRVVPERLQEAAAILEPTWQVTPQEIATWTFPNGVRLRTLVPPGERSAVEGLNQAIRRTREQYAETQAAVNAQKQLLEAAQKQLDTRKSELLGDPAAKEIEDRPEFSKGLVQALEDLEEERNAAQVAVDGLRRAIKSAADARTMIVQQLNEVVSRLPEPQSRVSQRQE
jgi:hypothetical protein